MIGGHSMCFVGYQDDANSPGGGYFILRNSWGSGWAPDSPHGAGYGTIPYEYIQKEGWEIFSALTEGESSASTAVVRAQRPAVPAAPLQMRKGAWPKARGAIAWSLHKLILAGALYMVYELFQKEIVSGATQVLNWFRP
jgi:hypothetical protein